MNILQINNCHYRRGGADVVYLDTSELLSRKGHNIIHFSTTNTLNESSQYSEYFVKSINPLKSNLLNKILLTPKSLYSFETSNKLKKLLTDFRIDIAHIHLYKGNLTASLLSILKKHKVPTVITLHDFNLLCPRNLFLDANNNVCEKCIEGSTLNCILKKCNRNNLLFSTVSFLEFNLNKKFFSPIDHFNTIISVSKFNFDKHISNFPTIKHKFKQLYNFTPKIDQIQLNSKKGKYFLYFGRVSREKGTEFLLNIFSKLNYPLKIVGTGEAISQLRYFYKNFKHIEFLGYKSGSELSELIRNCSFVLVPSICYENNPMTIIESYSHGKPVIGSRIGGIPEIIVENETGYTFMSEDDSDFNNVIEKAIRVNSTKYIEMSLAARKFAENNFSEEIHYKKLLQIYDDAIKEKNTSVL